MMIVKELESGHKRSMDTLFMYWLIGQLIKQTEGRKDVYAEAARDTFLALPKEYLGTLLLLLQDESQLLSLRGGLERFYSKGEPKLSAFVPRTVRPSAGNLNHLRAFPAFMAEWNASSRKVFQLGKQMQSLLEQTDYRELKKEDLVVPFPNFLIRLAVPVKIMGMEYCTIGFSEDLLMKEAHALSESGWGYLLLDKGDGYVSISEQKKRKIIRNLGSIKNFHENFLEMQKISSHVRTCLTQAVPVILSEDLKLLTAEHGTFSDPDDIKNFSRLHSIVVNLIAILPLLSKRGALGKNLNVKPGVDIASTNNVFEIGGISSLSSSGEAGLRMRTSSSDELARTIVPHWRRKHERRLPGMGHIPDAPKEVKVPRTLVLGNFLSEGEFPLGSVTKL